VKKLPARPPPPPPPPPPPAAPTHSTPPAADARWSGTSGSEPSVPPRPVDTRWNGSSGETNPPPRPPVVESRWNGSVADATTVVPRGSIIAHLQPSRSVDSVVQPTDEMWNVPVVNDVFVSTEKPSPWSPSPQPNCEDAEGRLEPKFRLPSAYHSSAGHSAALAAFGAWSLASPESLVSRLQPVQLPAPFPDSVSSAEDARWESLSSGVPPPMLLGGSSSSSSALPQPIHEMLAPALLEVDSVSPSLLPCDSFCQAGVPSEVVGTCDLTAEDTDLTQATVLEPWVCGDDVEDVELQVLPDQACAVRPLPWGGLRVGSDEAWDSLDFTEMPTAPWRAQGNAVGWPSPPAPSACASVPRPQIVRPPPPWASSHVEDVGQKRTPIAEAAAKWPKPPMAAPCERQSPWSTTSPHAEIPGVPAAFRVDARRAALSANGVGGRHAEGPLTGVPVSPEGWGPVSPEGWGPGQRHEREVGLGAWEEEDSLQPRVRPKALGAPFDVSMMSAETLTQQPLTPPSGPPRCARERSRDAGLPAFPDAACSCASRATAAAIVATSKVCAPHIKGTEDPNSHLVEWASPLLVRSQKTAGCLATAAAVVASSKGPPPPVRTRFGMTLQASTLR